MAVTQELLEPEPRALRCCRRRRRHDPSGIAGDFLARLRGVALDLRLEAWRFGHLRPQVDDTGGGNRAEAQHDPPRQIVAGARRQEEQSDQGAHNETERLHGEHHSDQSTAVLSVRVLAHEHRGDRVVPADAESKDEAGNHQPEESRSEGGGKCTDDHDGGDHRVDPFAAEDVSDPTEDEGAEECTEDGRSGHPARLERAQVPLNGDDGGDRADDEEVIGVGEEPDTRHEHCATVEFAPRGIVEKIADRRRPGSGHSVARPRRNCVHVDPFLAPLGSDRTTLLRPKVDARNSEDERHANTDRTFGELGIPGHHFVTFVSRRPSFR